MERNALGPRPRDYYGPEDHIEGCNPDEEEEEVRSKQKRWDIARAAMPWWRRILV